MKTEAFSSWKSGNPVMEVQLKGSMYQVQNDKLLEAVLFCTIKEVFYRTEKLCPVLEIFTFLYFQCIALFKSANYNIITSIELYTKYIFYNNYRTDRSLVYEISQKIYKKYYEHFQINFVAFSWTGN